MAELDELIDPKYCIKAFYFSNFYYFGCIVLGDGDNTTL